MTDTNDTDVADVADAADTPDDNVAVDTPATQDVDADAVEASADDAVEASADDAVEASADDAVEASADDAGVASADSATEGGADEAPTEVVLDADGKTPFEVEEWVFGAIEALCFVSADPMTPARIKDVITSELPLLDGHADMAGPTTAQVKEIFQELLRRWSDPTRMVGHGFRLVEVDGGLTLRTSAMQSRYVRRLQLGKPQKLSRAALETLAVVAYRQPVTKPQIEEVRGVDCSGALKALLDKKLVRILGKAEDVGRPLLYGTSKTFLEFFNLQSLNDLPTLKQLQELDGEAPPPIDESDIGSAMVMDLFQKDGPGLISAETEEESADALDALERALGEAKKAAKTASTLVFGIEVPDEEPKTSSSE